MFFSLKHYEEFPTHHTSLHSLSISKVATIASKQLMAWIGLVWFGLSVQ